jgi:hypothetical protein
LYGKGFAVLRDSPRWDEFAAHFTIHPSTRQIIVADIQLVQSSCGFGVPLYSYEGDRDLHFAWAEKQGEAGLQAYMEAKNLISLDGLPTHLSIDRQGGI